MAKHYGPSRRASRHNVILLALVEMVMAMVYLDAMAGLYFYPTIDWSNYMALPHLAANAKAVLYSVIWAALSVSAFRLMWFDTPITQEARAAYDATHSKEGRLRPWLKVMDDAISAYANKGRGVSATKFYDDISAAMDTQEDPQGAQPPLPATSSRKSE
jgi:hypothetical protein